MIEKIKKEILESKDYQEFYRVEDKFMNDYKSKIYNELLEDSTIKKKIAQLLEIDEKALGNALMINGNPPIDYYDDEEKTEK